MPTPLQCLSHYFHHCPLHTAFNGTRFFKPNFESCAVQGRVQRALMKTVQFTPYLFLSFFICLDVLFRSWLCLRGLFSVFLIPRLCKISSLQGCEQLHVPALTSSTLAGVRLRAGRTVLYNFRSKRTLLCTLVYYAVLTRTVQCGPETSFRPAYCCATE